jgi:hypothetical protein
MKWILVWWIIHPHHSQAVHIEKGIDSYESCVFKIAELAPRDKAVHWTCSEE